MIKQNILLSDFSNFKIGGNAKYFLDVSNVQELIDGLKKWKEIPKDFSQNQKRIFILGGGTNILFSDNGFDGLVVKYSDESISESGEEITVGGGTPLSKLLEFCIENSLSGMEWAGGLPGTVGGAVRGNAGAYNGEIKDNLIEVESLDVETLEFKKRNVNQCDFAYRTSVFKKNGDREIIINIKFKLETGDKEIIKAAVQEKIDARNKRHPLDFPNVGSIFKNVPVEKFDTKQFLYELSQYVKNDPFPVVPTAKVNFLAGLSGKRVGDAQLSEKHTNFIVNLGAAKSKDVHELIKIIKNAVKEKFNINLEEEVMFVD